MLKSIIYTICLLVLLNCGLQAQSGSHANGVQITGMAQLGLPQNDFAEAYTGNPSGFAGSIMFPVGKAKMLHFGGEYGWSSMGKEKTQVEIVKAPEEILAGDMSVSSDVKSYHANMRFSPLKGPFRVYFDLLFGMKVYSTDTEIVFEEANGSEVQTTSNLNNENTNFVGFAGGMMLAVSRNFFIDAKLQSLQGGEVKYVDQSNLGIAVNGDVDYSLKTTATDLLVPQVGLSIVF